MSQSDWTLKPQSLYMTLFIWACGTERERVKRKESKHFQGLISQSTTNFYANVRPDLEEAAYRCTLWEGMVLLEVS